jgi:PhnB protein
MAEEHRKYGALTPYLMVKDGAAAIDFYAAAFGAEVIERFDFEGKLGHATLSLNGGHLLLSDEYPEYFEFTGTQAPTTLGGTTVTVTLAVEDVDKVYDRAIAAGATVVRAPKDEFYGRQGKLRDPYGHVWSLAGPPKGA